MNIQWFPGHMHKARLEMQATLPKVDVVIEVLDSRIPYSSENPLLAEIRGDKPCLKVLAKSDLSDPVATKNWLEYLEQHANAKATAVSTDDVPTIRRLKSAIIGMAQHREGKSVTAMITGVPNVGKSTIINFLAGKKIAKTGNMPAVTRQQQRVGIGDGVALLDTPGMMWPNVHNPNSGYRLALIGSIKETAADETDVGFYAAKVLREQYAERLMERFELTDLPDDELGVIEAIGRRRGCLGRNGTIDLDRTARILNNEVRTGGLGRLTLETPDMMAREKVLTERAMAEKAERDRIKDEKRKKRFRDKKRRERKAREFGG